MLPGDLSPPRPGITVSPCDNYAPADNRHFCGGGQGTRSAKHKKADLDFTTIGLTGVHPVGESHLVIHLRTEATAFHPVSLSTLAGPQGVKLSWTLGGI